jgi:hypothetical protein
MLPRVGIENSLVDLCRAEVGRAALLHLDCRIRNADHRESRAQNPGSGQSVIMQMIDREK